MKKHTQPNPQSIANNAFSPAALKLWLSMMFICTAALVVFYPALHAGFVDWDDPDYLITNSQLLPFSNSWSWAAVGHIFTSSINGNYNPLPIFTFAIEKYLFANDPVLNPFIFHLDNVLLHMVASLLAWTLARKLGLGNIGALVVGLLFAIHPMRVESVAWVTERKDVLYGASYLGALVCYVSYVQEQQKRKMWFALCILLSSISYLSKVQAVSLPLSMLAIDFYIGRKWRTGRILIFEKLPWWVLSLVVGAVNIYTLSKLDVIGNVTAELHYSVLDKIATGAYTYIRYLISVVAPYKLSHFYEYPDKPTLIAYLSILLAPAILFVALLKPNTPYRKTVAFGVLFFTCSVLFVLQMLPAGNAYMANRFTYIPYWGIFFLLGATIEYLLQQEKINPRFLIAGIALWVLAIGIESHTLAGTWHDSITLLDRYIDCNPHSHHGYNRKGSYILRTAITQNGMPDSADATTAYRCFKSAYDMDSISGAHRPSVTAEICENLGITAGMLGLDEEAIYYFDKAVYLLPEDAETYRNRGYYYFLRQSYPLALADYEEAVRHSTPNASLYYMRANCLYAMHRTSEARPYIDSAILLAPNDANNYMARASINKAENKVDEAKADAMKARSLGGNVPDSFFQ